MAKDMDTIWQDKGAFRQQVRMAAVQVAALSANELAYALAYEVEPFSGIPAAEAEVSWREVADPDTTVKVYEVVARRRRSSSAKSGVMAGRLLKPAVVVAALAIVVAGADAAWLAHRKGALEKTVAGQSLLEAQLNAVRAKASAARAEASRIRDGRDAANRAQQDVAALRAAYPGVMATVASVCGGKVVVKTFAAKKPFALEMTAVAASADDAAAVMAGLARAVAEKGWHLSPGPIAANAGGVTAEFSCTLALVAAANAEEAQ